jgi:hypothetical protein
LTDASSGRLGVAHQLTNLAAVVIPLLAFALAIVML